MNVADYIRRAFCNKLWTTVRASTPPIEELENSLADAAKTVLLMTHQDVVWVAVTYLFGLGVVVAGRGIAKERGIERREMMQKWEDDRQERRAKLEETGEGG